ncbi:MAG: hypothetical protein WC830_15670, partial [Burkholderiales bacterium]
MSNKPVAARICLIAALAA